MYLGEHTPKQLHPKIELATNLAAFPHRRECASVICFVALKQRIFVVASKQESGNHLLGIPLSIKIPHQLHVVLSSFATIVI